MKKEYISPTMVIISLQNARLMTTSKELHGETGARYYRNKLWEDDEEDELGLDL